MICICHIIASPFGSETAKSEFDEGNSGWADMKSSNSSFTCWCLNLIWTFTSTRLYCLCSSLFLIWLVFVCLIFCFMSKLFLSHVYILHVKLIIRVWGWWWRWNVSDSPFLSSFIYLEFLLSFESFISKNWYLWKQICHHFQKIPQTGWRKEKIVCGLLLLFVCDLWFSVLFKWNLLLLVDAVEAHLQQREQLLW